MVGLPHLDELHMNFWNELGHIPLVNFIRRLWVSYCRLHFKSDGIIFFNHCILLQWFLWNFSCRLRSIGVV